MIANGSRLESGNILDMPVGGGPVVVERREKGRVTMLGSALSPDDALREFEVRRLGEAG